MFNFFNKHNPDRHFRDTLSSGFGDDNLDLAVIKCPLMDFNTQTQVQVGVGELAVFIENGKVVQLIEPQTTPVKTAGLPFFSNFRALFYGGNRVNTCSLYFIRTTPREGMLWGTPNNRLSVPDPQYHDYIAYVGANGSYNISLEKEQIELFFTQCVPSKVSSVSYEMLENKLSPIIIAQFNEAIINAVNNYGYVEKLTIADINPKIENRVCEAIYRRYGLTVSDFKLAGIVVEDSPERANYKAFKSGDVIKVESHESDTNIRLKDADTDDIVARREILRNAFQTQVLQEAEAQGKKNSLAILGDDWLKVRISEVVEVALSNPAVSQIGTSALGGFIGANSGMFADMISGLVNGLKGNPSNKPAHSYSQESAYMFTPLEDGAVMSGLDYTASPYSPTLSGGTEDSQASSPASNIEKNEKILEQLLDMYSAGKISFEFYMKQIEKLK